MTAAGAGGGRALDDLAHKGVALRRARPGLDLVDDGPVGVIVPAGRTDGRSAATTRGLRPGVVLDNTQQAADGGRFPWKLHPHGTAALFVHGRERLSTLCIKVLCNIHGAQTANATETTWVLGESGGALRAVGCMTLEVLEDKELIGVEIAHHEDGLDNLNGARHGG